MHKVSPEFLQIFFYPAISKWGYELAGGICEINSRVALTNPLIALHGDFINKWWILAAFPVLLYGVATLALWRKDKKYD